MTDHDTNLRDLAAMFAMNALIISKQPTTCLMEDAFDYADQFMETRELKVEEQQGIVAIKKKKKNVPE